MLDLLQFFRTSLRIKHVNKLDLDRTLQLQMLLILRFARIGRLGTGILLAASRCVVATLLREGVT